MRTARSTTSGENFGDFLIMAPFSQSKEPPEKAGRFTVPTTNNTPHTVDSLLRVVEAREAEVALLKLMVDKLTLQLLRARRATFGRSSEQFDDPQLALIEGEPLDEVPAPASSAKPDAANDAGIDRHLPAHLPRENLVHRPDATDAHRDGADVACGCSACGGRLRQIGADVSEQLEFVPSRFKVIRHV
ncbi:MAG TPA: IS66 family transposase zinc-finger binding domain-containing protein, partial [Burkholderiaceae bacterium]